MKFSERSGYISARDSIQTDEMSRDLRASIWNALDDVLFSRQGFVSSVSRGRKAEIKRFSRLLWRDFFKERTDSRPEYGFEILNTIREWFFTCEWYEIYDILEFVAAHYPAVIEPVNQMLERELSGYRIVGGIVSPITSEEEIEAIDSLLRNPEMPSSVRTHIEQALRHFSNRDSPDYRNSIKESICAVESICQDITGNRKATLGDALKILEKKHKLHPALKDGFSKLYGYTSDADGIRHAMLEEPDLESPDALYFLVSCSAFINYLRSKNS